MKKIIIALVIIVVLIGAGFLFFNKSQPASQLDGRTILFFRPDCVHCQNVEKYITDNKVDNKITMEKLDVSNDQTNVNLLLKKASFCKIDTSRGVPIPFLWVNNTCIIGDQDIIKYFGDKKK